MRNKWLFRPQVSSTGAAWKRRNSPGRAGCAAACSRCYPSAHALCVYLLGWPTAWCLYGPANPLQHSPEQLAHLPEAVTISDVRGEPFAWQPQASGQAALRGTRVLLSSVGALTQQMPECALPATMLCCSPGFQGPAEAYVSVPGTLCGASLEMQEGHGTPCLADVWSAALLPSPACLPCCRTRCSASLRCRRG